MALSIIIPRHGRLRELTPWICDIGGSIFLLNHEEVKLQPYLKMNKWKNLGGYIKLISRDGSRDYLSFSVSPSTSVRAYKITSDKGRDFLLFWTYREAVDGSSSFDNMWLVGKVENKYVTYATKVSLDKAGLLYSNISPEVHSGQLEITGYTRCYGKPDGGWGPPGDKYKGKSFRFIDKRHMWRVSKTAIFS